jgi:hypothetical protein
VRGFITTDDPENYAATASLEQSARSILAIKAEAARFGFDYQFRKSRIPGLQHARFLGKRLPSDQKLIEALLVASEVTEPGIGLTMHRITSATAHGQSHGSRFFMLEAKESFDPGIGLVQMGLSLNHFSALLGAVFLGLQNVWIRLRDYYGWPDEPWLTRMRAANSTYNEWLDVERRANALAGAREGEQ